MQLIEKRDRLTEEYRWLPGAQERFDYLLEQSQEGPALSAEERAVLPRVEGCLAQVWVTAELREGKVYYRSDSDAPMVRAIAWLLCDFYSGGTPEEIATTDPDFLQDLRLLDALTENRRRGTRHIVSHIRVLARSVASSA